MRKPLSPAFEDARWMLPDNGRCLLIRGTVLAHIFQHRQLAASASEAGGQLFAQLSEGNVEICHATGPYPSDSRARFGFRPDRKRQKADIHRWFQEGFHYVGDWHTHPVTSPQPSQLDLESMRDCFHRSLHELDSFLMVIVGKVAMADLLWVSLHTASEYVRLIPFSRDSN